MIVGDTTTVAAARATSVEAQQRGHQNGRHCQQALGPPRARRDRFVRAMIRSLST